MKINLRNPRFISALWKSLAGIHWLTLCILTFRISAYFSELHAERIQSMLPHFLQSDTPPHITSQTPVDRPPAAKSTESNKLRVEIQDKIRSIHQHRAILERELREKKIHIQLLNTSGYSAKSHPVQELSAQIEFLEEKLQESEQEALKAKDLLIQLDDALSSSESGNDKVSVGKDLKLRIREAVSDMDPLAPPTELIPEDVWEPTFQKED